MALQFAFAMAQYESSVTSIAFFKYIFGEMYFGEIIKKYICVCGFFGLPSKALRELYHFFSLLFDKER